MSEITLFGYATSPYVRKTAAFLYYKELPFIHVPVNPMDPAGLGNCLWTYDELRQAIARQPKSPHQLLNVDGSGYPSGGYGMTKFEGAHINTIDDFVNKILKTNPPPF